MKLYCIIYLPNEEGGSWRTDHLCPNLEHVKDIYNSLNHNNLTIGYYDLDEMMMLAYEEDPYYKPPIYNKIELCTSDSTGFDLGEHCLYLLNE